MNIHKSILFLILFFVSNLWSLGMSAGETITNGGDRNISGINDVPGDSLIFFASMAMVSFYNSSQNITIATVNNAYDVSSLAWWPDSFMMTGDSVIYSYSVTNHGNISDSIRVHISEASNSGSGAFTGGLYTLLQGTNILLGPAANIDWNSPFIASEGRIDFEVKVDVPVSSVDGDQNTISVNLYDSGGTGINDQWPYSNAPILADLGGVRDHQTRTITVKAQKNMIHLSKKADYRYIFRGDSLWYTIGYSNVSVFSISNCFIEDDVPAGSLYEINSAETNNMAHSGLITTTYWDGSVWQNNLFDAFATYGLIRKIRWKFNDSVGPGETGHVMFRVKVN